MRGVRLRRELSKLAMLLATIASLSAPLFFGVGGAAMLGAFGVQVEHHCSCGMQAGKCGCVECAAEEGERLSARDQAKRIRVVRSSCDDGEAMSTLRTLAPSSLPASSIMLRPPPSDVVVRVASPSVLPRRRLAPPTPPPRSLLV